MISDQDEGKEPKTKELSINKGVELMLRRDKKTEPQTNGFKFSHSLTLLKKQFSFKVEFNWRRVDTQN